jgi:glycosyltransferase involved in cell wall biosynthesis
MCPIVSVIIPTYNRAALLKRAVDSVLGQTYQHFELIVVSDGSTDNTDEVIKSFNDNRIRYLKHGKSRGASAARNTGIKASKGKYIAFLDDDDEWLPKKLEKQVLLIQSLPDKFGMVYCWMDYFDESGKLIKKHHPKLKGYVFPHVLDAQRIGGCPTLLVHREVIEKIGGFDESLPRGNDGDFIRRVCKEYEVDFVPEVLVRVHIGHTDRISSVSEQSLRNRVKGGETKLRKFSDDLKRFPEAHASILRKLALTYLKLGEDVRVEFYLRQAMKVAPLNAKLYIDWIRLKLRSFGSRG